MKKFILFIAFVGSAAAQTGYVIQKTSNLSAAAEVITIQQPASGSKLVEFQSAYVDCSVACTVTIERNGASTPATSTTLTTVNINPNELPSTATAWSSSNVGTGTVLNVVSLGAGSYIVFDLAGIYFPARNDKGTNLTIRTSAITGVTHIAIKWTEK